MSDTTVDPTLLDADLAEQSAAVVDWLRTLDDDVFDTPTPLPGWRVRDVVAHVGLAMTVLASAQAAEGEADDERRHDLASYLGSYSDNAEGIRERAVELAGEQEHDPVGDVEGRVQLAVENLTRLRAAGVLTVRVRRGLIPLTSLVLTRLVELVVHADDLARSVHVTSPVDPTARTIVSDALLAIVRRRSGYELDVVDEKVWVRLATGRVTWDERGNALRPGNLSEGLPDLRAFLPLV